MYVWLSLPSDGWKRGIIEATDGSKLQIKIGEEIHAIDLDGKDMALRVQFAGGEESTATDLSTLQHANEPSMLEALNDRYQAGKIFTFAGSTLICVNPFQPTALFTPEMMNHYVVANMNVAKFSSSLSNDQKDKEPHLYQTAMNAVQQMFRESPKGRNQTIVISGESGAGKSEVKLRERAIVAHTSN